MIECVRLESLTLGYEGNINTTERVEMDLKYSKYDLSFLSWVSSSLLNKFLRCVLSIVFFQMCGNG